MQLIEEPYVDSIYIQKKFIGFLNRNCFDFCFENKNIYGKESDIIACKDYLAYEYEVKTSESDFRKDIKKERHQFRKPNYFFYIVKDLSNINGEYLDYAGIYLHTFASSYQSKFKLIKEAKMLHDGEITQSALYVLLDRIYNSKRKD